MNFLVNTRMYGVGFDPITEYEIIELSNSVKNNRLSWYAIDNKPNQFKAEPHHHVIDDVDGLREFIKKSSANKTDFEVFKSKTKKELEAKVTVLKCFVITDPPFNYIQTNSIYTYIGEKDIRITLPFDNKKPSHQVVVVNMSDYELIIVSINRHLYQKDGTFVNGKTIPAKVGRINLINNGENWIEI